MKLGFHHVPWEDLEATDETLRAKCKLHLHRLANAIPGVDSGLSTEKLTTRITELKIKWNRQEFRFTFCRLDGQIFILSFFQKKTRKTPKHEIDLAESRMKDIQLDRAEIHNGLN